MTFSIYCTRRRGGFRAFQVYEVPKAEQTKVHLASHLHGFVSYELHGMVKILCFDKIHM